MTTDADIIGKRIRYWRTHKGWTQTELAAQTGVKLNQVLAWEKGRHIPALKRRPLVAKALGVEPEVLFCVGAERDFAMQEVAANVMLGIARKDDASPTQKLNAVKGLISKPAKVQQAEDQMAQFRREMQKADDDLTRLLAEIDADEK